MGASVEVTDQSFDTEVVGSSVLTVADLWAEWCAPCKRLTPILEEIAQEYQGRIRVAKLDVDSNPDVPGRYGVQGLPTLLVFKNGQMVETIVGFKPKSRLLELITPHL